VTLSETTSEKKRSRSYWGFGLIGAVVLVAAALIFWPRAGGRQTLSFTVLDFSTNWIGTDGPLPQPAGFPATPVCARIAVTNNTEQTLILQGRSSFEALKQTESGWRGVDFKGAYFLPLGPLPSKLPPGQGFTFGVVLPTDTPCKVGVNYLSGRLSGRLWQKLPDWLTKKLSWASPWRTATTEVIDLSRL